MTTEISEFWFDMTDIGLCADCGDEEGPLFYDGDVALDFYCFYCWSTNA